MSTDRRWIRATVAGVEQAEGMDMAKFDDPDEAGVHASVSAKVLALAAEQDGMVARFQAPLLGVSPDAFDHHMRQLGLPERHRGVWQLPGVDRDPWARARAAALSVRPPLALTGLAALAAAQVVDPWPDTIAAVVPSRRHLQPRDGVSLTRTTSFEAMPLRHMRGLPFVAPAWAFTDAAAETTIDDLVHALAKADGLRRCTPAEVTHVVDSRRGFTGRRRLRRALALALGGMSHSAAEARGRRILLGLGLGFTTRPYRVIVSGRVIGELDVAVPRLKYGVEIDGPHHLFGEQPAVDRARDRNLAREGWLVDRFLTTTIDDNPRRFGHEVHQSVVSRARELGVQLHPGSPPNGGSS